MRLYEVEIGMIKLPGYDPIYAIYARLRNTSRNFSSDQLANRDSHHSDSLEMSEM